MSVGVAIVICIAVFIYIEVAIGVGYYMYILTSRKMPEADEKQKKQIRQYSIVAGVAFPVTFAILVANKAAERRR